MKIIFPLLAMARRMGANGVLDYRAVEVVAEVKRRTGGALLHRIYQ